MNWLKLFKPPQQEPLSPPPPKYTTAENKDEDEDDKEMFILVDIVNDDGDKIPAIEPISLMDCLSIYTSYMDTTPPMPKTPSNTPIDTPKSTFAYVYDGGMLSPYETPSELDILSGLTNISSFSSLIITPPVTPCNGVTPCNTVEDIDYNLPTMLHAPQHPTTQPPQYCTSLTPMLLHGGIPITFMIMAQFGIGTIKANPTASE